MLVSMDPKRLYELIHFFSRENNKHILVINNENLLLLDETKKEEVKNYYTESITEDEIGEIFANQYNFYEFDSKSQAVDTAYDWFPQYKDLEDTDYYIECYVISPSGSIPYTNKTIPKPQTI